MTSISLSLVSTGPTTATINYTVSGTISSTEFPWNVLVVGSGSVSGLISGSSSAAGGSGTASISGLTPSTSYTWTFQVDGSATGVLASNSVSGTTTAAVAPSWNDQTLAAFYLGIAYSDGVSASGTGSTSYSVSVGSLPAGISLNSSTGAVTGTPTAVGSYSFTLRASNSYGNTTKAFSGTVTAPPVWSDKVLADFISNQAYSDGVAATNMSYSGSYSISSGTLPNGITLDTNTGVVSGTTSDVGGYSFTITATNTYGSVDALFAGSISGGPSLFATPAGYTLQRTLTSTGSVSIPAGISTVFAVLVGGGGSGGGSTQNTGNATGGSGGGGGGGAVISGFVPAKGSVVIGAGGIAVAGAVGTKGGTTYYSTLYATGGTGGGINSTTTIATGAAGTGGPGITSTAVAATSTNSFMYNIGGAGGASRLTVNGAGGETANSAPSNYAGAAGGAGGFLMDGTSTTGSGTKTAGSGGSGIVAGGGGGCTRQISSSGAIIGGAGGNSLAYTGGAGGNTGANGGGTFGGSGGGGGAGILGNGFSGTATTSSASSLSAGGAGGSGGGGGGGAAGAQGGSSPGGNGGNGCVLLYW